MRILICSESAALGGMERRIEAETSFLTGLGHEVFVATSRFPGFEEWGHVIEQAGGKWIDWRSYKFIEGHHFSAPFRWLAMSSLPLLGRHRIDLAHIAMPKHLHGFSRAFALRKARIPFVVSVHSNFEGSALPAREAVIVRQALSGLVGGYGVSSPVLNNFLKIYEGLLPVHSELEVVPNGIDTGRFRPDPATRNAMRQELGYDDTHFVVMSCGRLHSYKRPLFAIRVLAELIALEPRSRMLFVGDGPEVAAVYSEAAKLGIANHVIITGQVSDTAPYYSASDCYLSTSQSEGCPLAPAEALATGLPAVVPDDATFAFFYGRSEAVQRCDRMDETAWVPVLHALSIADQEARVKSAKLGREFAVRNFSLSVMHQRLGTFYDRVFHRLASTPDTRPLEQQWILATMHVAVTGGAGFIGSHSVEALLAAGARVRVLDNFSSGGQHNLPKGEAGLEVIECDIRSNSDVTQALDGVTHVLHLAAQVSVKSSVEEPTVSCEHNVTGFVNVLDAARRRGVRRFVYASSAAVYGVPSALPLSEESPVAPISPYGLEKWIDERYAALYSELYGFRSLGLRYFNVYGPRQDAASSYAGVISKFAASIRSGSELRIFGDGEQTRDFVFVADVARFNLLALAGTAEGICNIGTGRSITLLNLIAALEQVSGRTAQRRFEPPSQGDIRGSGMCSQRLLEWFGEIPSTSLAAGLSALLSQAISS